jgi:hypothetical protein
VLAVGIVCSFFPFSFLFSVSFLFVCYIPVHCLSLRCHTSCSLPGSSMCGSFLSSSFHTLLNLAPRYVVFHSLLSFSFLSSFMFISHSVSDMQYMILPRTAQLGSQLLATLALRPIFYTLFFRTLLLKMTNQIFKILPVFKIAWLHAFCLCDIAYLLSVASSPEQWESSAIISS